MKLPFALITTITRKCINLHPFWNYNDLPCIPEVCIYTVDKKGNKGKTYISLLRFAIVPLCFDFRKTPWARNCGKEECFSKYAKALACTMTRYELETCNLIIPRLSRTAEFGSRCNLKK